jgi:hypothetical protein
LVEQLPVDGPELGVEYHLVACGGDVHDDVEEVGGAVGTDHQPSAGSSPTSSTTSSGVGRWHTGGEQPRRTSGRIDYRRVKVRWVTPLGDETASTS